MCSACVEAIRKHFPDCPDDKMGAFLLGATCFPAGTADDIERQLSEAKAAGCETWEDACAYADEVTDRTMKEIAMSEKKPRVETDAIKHRRAVTRLHEARKKLAAAEAAHLKSANRIVDATKELTDAKAAYETACAPLLPKEEPKQP